MKTASKKSHNPMTRIAVASLTGTVIEFYDFFVYGTAAALVFSKVFFPELGAAQGTVLAFATFGVAFVARPFGSILFGHFGDRIGRKKTLVATLLLMGLATLAVGLLPPAGVIGAAAPILLVILRVAQGLAVGGEWAGATLLTAENAPRTQRGKYSLYPQLGPSIAFALASATFLTITLTMSNEAFLSWGWRLPFIGSILLVGVGLFVRLKIEETAAFRSATATAAQNRSRLPLVEVITRQPRAIILGSFVTMPIFGFFYIGVAYLTTYGSANLHHSYATVLSLGIVGGIFFAMTTAFGAIASDRYGRRRMVLIGNASAAVVGLIVFPVLDLGTPLSFAIGLCLLLGVVGIAYGPVGALLPELFNVRYRYTGAGMAYNIAGVLGGAVTPLVATQLVSSFGSASIGVYLSFLAVVGAVCALALRDTRDVEMAATASDVSDTAVPLAGS